MQIQQYIKNYEKIDKKEIFYKKKLEELKDLTNKIDKNDINLVQKRFKDILNNNINITYLIPYSKNLEGNLIFSITDFWIILITINLIQNDIKNDETKFLELMNVALTYDLDDLNKFKNFYFQKCQELFSKYSTYEKIKSNKYFKKNEIKLPEDYIFLLKNYQVFNEDKKDFIKIRKILNKLHKEKIKIKKSKSISKYRKIGNRNGKKNEKYNNKIINIRDKFKKKYIKKKREYRNKNNNEKLNNKLNKSCQNHPIDTINDYLEENSDFLDTSINSEKINSFLELSIELEKE